MNSRHEAREWAVQFLFQRDFNPGELDVALADFWATRNPSAKSRTFAEDLICGVERHMEEIDAHIQRYAEHWDVKRMGALDRNVMRVALYEMLYRHDIPPVVSINEAVEIAKAYSSRESGRFVNGILDQICKHLDRPARRADHAVPSKVEETS